MSPAILVKAAASILTNEKSRKAVGWVLTAVLSPIILLLAFFCTSFSGGAEHNRTVVDLCFHGGAVPEGTPAEYQAYIQEMRDSFALLDAAMQTMEGQMEDGDGLDDIRVKAVFFALYFGTDDPAAHAGQTFVDCFVTYEERTRTVTTVDEEGNEVETHETYTVAVTAGLAGVCETKDGSITFWAENVPEGGIQMQVELLGPSASTADTGEDTLGDTVLDDTTL